ncbi:hypothetical protein FACS1894216_15680 [Synergistales bacterium]|nr:hypothetical protein FACS1894216_15680 [Synergistales bacterium]
MKCKSSAAWMSVILLFITLAQFCAAARAGASPLEPGQRRLFKFVAPIENNSGVAVWRNKYYPNDVLSEMMTDYVFRKLKSVEKLDSVRLLSDSPETWASGGYSEDELILKINMEQFEYKKKDNLGSKWIWNVVLHTYVYNAADAELLFDSIIAERGDHRSLTYNDMMERKPVYWDVFEKSPYWPAIRRALDRAVADAMSGGSGGGYEATGRIIAKAERVDGSYTVPKKQQDKLYHIDLGYYDGVRVGDVLEVRRASSVRTVDPEKAEIHFPQVIGRVKAVHVKKNDAVVAIIKESKDAPIELGDVVSKRTGSTD